MTSGFVYILGNLKPVLYVGVTSNLVGRIWEHKNKIYPGFTSKYKISKLLYYEYYEDIREALIREKALKNWLRHWKLELVRKFNPTFIDLYSEVCEGHYRSSISAFSRVKDD